MSDPVEPIAAVPDAERDARRRATSRHPTAAAPPAPIELTEAALEALLFVAERPLSRREIATLAGTDRATVDARLGDLEVSLRDARHPAAGRWRPGRAGDRARGRRAGRPLRRRRRRPPVAGVARDAGDRGLPPARDEVGGRADPRRRFGLHDPDAAPSPARRRARPLRGAGPAVPVRHRLRVPRAVRADEPRRAAAARRRRRGAARRGGRRGRTRPSRLDARRRRGRRQSDRRRLDRLADEARADAARAAPEGPRRVGRRVAPGERGADRQRPGHGRRQAGEARRCRSTRTRRSSRSTAASSAPPSAPEYLLLHKPAGVTSTVRDRHAVEDRPRHDPDRAAPRGRPALPGRAARPGLRGPARPDQRRGLGRPGAPPAPRHRARVRDRPARGR